MELSAWLETPRQLYKAADGFRRVTSAAQRCDGYQTRVIQPSNLIFYQFLDITFSGNDVGQIHLRKLNLARRVLNSHSLTTQS